MTIFTPNSFEDKLLLFLEGELNKLSRQPAEPPATKPELSMEEQQQTAARTIQNAWRTSDVMEKFSQDGYMTYLAMPRQNTNMESEHLALLFFGNTVSAFSNENKPNFPINNPYPFFYSTYHRFLVPNYPLQGAENIFGYYTNLNIFPLKDYTYIPIAIVSNTPIEEIIQDTEVCILKKPNIPLGFLRVPKHMAPLVTKLIRETGLIAPPLCIGVSQIKLGVRATKPAPIPIQNTLFSYLPDNIKALRKSRLIIKLETIANNNHYPTHWLAYCLHKMLMNLPVSSVKNEIVLRISIFLSISLNFHFKNYEKFSVDVYCIVHEISLLLFMELQEGRPIVQYDAFKKYSTSQTIKMFGLKNDKADYFFIASPCLSGTHAHLLAMKLARKILLRSQESPCVKIIEPQYFEFSDLYKSSKTQDAPNIYCLSAGPVVDNAEGIIPGVDINKLIRKIIFQFPKKLDKNIIFIVDTTTALYKNLILDDDIQIWLKNGKRTIFLVESGQKFRLAHTDLPQSAFLYGVSGCEILDEPNLKKFEENSEQDLLDHLDMTVSVFISMHCDDYLECIKEQHFKNGDLLCDFFTKFNVLNEHNPPNEIQLNPNHMCFLVGDSPKLIAQLDDRTSFGHYSTTVTAIPQYHPALPQYYRISPDASDRIDTLILGTQLMLASFKNSSELIEILGRMNECPKKTGSDLSALDIMNIGILLCLKNMDIQEWSGMQYCIFIDALEKISHLGTPLMGRRSWKTLVEYYASLKKEENYFRFTSKTLQKNVMDLFSNPTIKNKETAFNDLKKSPFLNMQSMQDYQNLSERNRTKAALLCLNSEIKIEQGISSVILLPSQDTEQILMDLSERRVIEYDLNSYKHNILITFVNVDALELLVQNNSIKKDLAGPKYFKGVR